MIIRKKKKCSLCNIFTEGTVKFNGKIVCFSCLEKLSKPAEKTVAIKN